MNLSLKRVIPSLGLKSFKDRLGDVHQQPWDSGGFQGFQGLNISETELT